MDGKTLLLVLLGGGVAAYLAYSLAKPAPASPSGGGGTGDAGQTPPAVDYGDAGAGLGFGLGNLGQDALCRVAPSLCSWWWDFNRRPQPGGGPGYFPGPGFGYPPVLW